MEEEEEGGEEEEGEVGAAEEEGGTRAGLLDLGWTSLEAISRIHCYRVRAITQVTTIK
jgi:hypothetical protein